MAEVLAHHARQADRHTEPVPPSPAPSDNPEALDVLFGRSS
ncbi:hypothetical protein [Streptomyces chartreusis]